MNRYIFSLIFLISTLIIQTSCANALSADAKMKPDELALTRAANAPESLEPVSAPTPKSAPKKPANAVCGIPSKPCRHRQKTFDDWELSFQMPARLIANKSYRSAPFYAVIVKKYEDGCEDFDVNPVAEPERAKLQKRFPANKVFAEYSCPDLSAVGYDFDGKLDAAGEKVLYMDYIAVYAGDSVDDAKRLLGELKNDFPQAEIKKMTANFGTIEQ